MFRKKIEIILNLGGMVIPLPLRPEKQPSILGKDGTSSDYSFSTYDFAHI